MMNVEALAGRVAGGLDWGRARALRFTLSWSPLRRIFGHRAHRLLALYLAALVFYLALALLEPLWVLVLGPVIWGFPHLLASLRFTRNSLADRRSGWPSGPTLFRFVGTVWVAVAIYRALAKSGRLGLPVGAAPWPEILAMFVTVAGCAVLCRKSPARIAGACFVLAPLVAVSWLNSQWAAGALVLVHNAVAFGYWIHATRTREEGAVAWGAFGLFICINAAIFMGAFDWVGPGWTRPSAPAWAQLDWASLGQWMLPGATDARDWFHAVVAFAFGQSLHYFVWLKAIPDQHHNREAPATFRRSAQLLFEDCGRPIGAAFLLVLVLGVGIWALLSFEKARALYFAAAAFHGFFELAGLSLISWNRGRGR